MKTIKYLILTTAVTLFAGCATTVPIELVNARDAHQRASSVITAQAAPAELYVANQALAKAEQSFKDDADSYKTRDLAYVAQRKSELAEAAAAIVNDKKRKNQAKDDYQATQGKIVKKTKQELRDTRTELAASERSGEVAAERLSDEQIARTDAEQRAADAQAALAKLASVKQDSRGMVLTLSGSVLFTSNKAILLPEARTRLNQIADVLLTTRERNITIEGHADSRGSNSHNMELSQRRADAVRNYLVQRGYQADRITANGLGERQPIADNITAEGRANNRRVEIIIEREGHTSIR